MSLILGASMGIESREEDDTRRRKLFVSFSQRSSFSSTSGYYMRLPGDSSDIFRTSDLRRFGTDRLGLLKTTHSSPSRLPTRNITKRTFKYVLPRFSNCSEDSEGSVLIAGSSVHGSKSNLKTAAKREGSHIESLEAAIYEGTVNKYRHSDSIKKVKTENSG
ncbi:hypothetical protein YC2023_045470 [Brassica napus]